MTVAEQLGCEEQVFLTPVLQAYESDGWRIGSETTLAVGGLKAALETIRTTGDDYDRSLLSAIDRNFATLDLASYSREERTGLEVGHILTAKLERADPEQIVNFANWYHGRVRQLGAQLNKDQPILEYDTLKRTASLIANGTFPKTAYGLMVKSTAWARQITPIGSVEQAANSYNGLCVSEGIALANLYTSPTYPAGIEPRLKQTAFHEHLHAVGHIPGERRSLFWGLTERQPWAYNLWLEEAYVSQIAYKAIMPSTRRPLFNRLLDPYPVEEQLLDVLMRTSRLLLNESILSDAFFSGRQPRTKIRQHVARGLSIAANELCPQYENDAWDQINQNYNGIERRIDRSKYLGGLLLSAGIKPIKQTT